MSNTPPEPLPADPPPVEAPTTLALADAPVVVAPDGARVHVLLAQPAASTARFVLGPGQVSAAVVHRRVDELWHVLEGRGALWRAVDGAVDGVTTVLRPGDSVRIVAGTAFQWRADADADLVVFGVTLPAWPGADEARPVRGPWAPTAPPPPV